MARSIDMQYRDLLEDIESHKDLLHLELTVATASESLGFYNAFESRRAQVDNEFHEERRGMMYSILWIHGFH